MSVMGQAVRSRVRSTWVRLALTGLAVMTLSAAAMAEPQDVQDSRFDRGLAKIEHVVAASGEGMVITGQDVNLDRLAQGYEQELLLITPAFGKDVVTTTGLVSVAWVSGGKVTKVEKLDAETTIPVSEVPKDGYLLVGYGRATFLLELLAPGSSVQVVGRKPVSPNPLPKVIKSGTGETIDISAWNRGRRADEILVYTRDYATHTFTNEWGTEAVVVDGKVVEVRAVGTVGMVEIPENGYVVSGHGAASAWIADNLQEGEMVELGM